MYIYICMYIYKCIYICIYIYMFGSMSIVMFFSTGFSITPSIYLLSMHPSLSLNISTNLCVETGTGTVENLLHGQLCNHTKASGKPGREVENRRSIFGCCC